MGNSPSNFSEELLVTKIENKWDKLLIEKLKENDQWKEVVSDKLNFKNKIEYGNSLESYIPKNKPSNIDFGKLKYIDACQNIIYTYHSPNWTLDIDKFNRLVGGKTTLEEVDFEKLKKEIFSILKGAQIQLKDDADIKDDLLEIILWTKYEKNVTLSNVSKIGTAIHNAWALKTYYDFDINTFKFEFNPNVLDKESRIEQLVSFDELDFVNKMKDIFAYMAIQWALETYKSGGKRLNKVRKNN